MDPRLRFGMSLVGINTLILGSDFPFGSLSGPPTRINCETLSLKMALKTPIKIKAAAQRSDLFSNLPNYFIHVFI